MKTVVILTRAGESARCYAVEQYMHRWIAAGHRVLVHAGTAEPPAGDIALMHVDLSVVPSEYAALASAYPKTLNGAALDIRRRRFSELQLRPGDPYHGPVIVKTDANFGGVPEHGTDSRGRTPVDWGSARTLDPLRYPVFPSLARVPPEVFENEALIVERFLDTRHGALSRLGYVLFFGDRHLAGRLSAPDPIVKFANAVHHERIPVPAAAGRWREALGLDFGRLDFLTVAGRDYLIDANKTEGGGVLNDEYAFLYDHLAPAIDECFP